MDFCINQTNLGSSIDNPITCKVSDSSFRDAKRRFTKDKKAVEIAMQPIGGKSYFSKMPDYLPVRLHFNNLKGLNVKSREIIHEKLSTGENPLITFTV